MNKMPIVLLFFFLLVLQLGDNQLVGNITLEKLRRLNLSFKNLMVLFRQH